MEGTWESKIAAASAARLAVFRQIGTPSDDVLAPLIGPALMGGPPWPVRPAWRLIRRADSIILASDGLSNPWQDRPGPGHGLEVFMETREPLLPEDAELTVVASTWLFSAVAEISNVIAGHGGVRSLIEELGTVSVEIAGERFPADHRNEHSRVGVLLGVSTRGLPTAIHGPDGEVYLVPITLLTRAELKHIVEVGDKARAAIAQRLAESEDGHLAVLDRETVMDESHGGPPPPPAPARAAKAAAQAAPKPSTKKVAAKKPVAKAAPAAKKATAKKPAAKKPAAKKPAAKKAAPKKAAPKKAPAKKAKRR
jgi:hypothetical protein